MNEKTRNPSASLGYIFENRPTRFFFLRLDKRQTCVWVGNKLARMPNPCPKEQAKDGAFLPLRKMKGKKDHKNQKENEKRERHKNAPCSPCQKLDWFNQGLFLTSLPIMIDFDASRDEDEDEDDDAEAGSPLAPAASLLSEEEPGCDETWTAKSQAARMLRRWWRR